MPLVDDGDQYCVGGGEDACAAGAAGSAPWPASLFKAALRCLGLLRGGKFVGQGAEFGAAQAGDPLVGQQAQCLDPVAGSVAGRGRCRRGAGRCDRLVPFTVVVVRMDRQVAQFVLGDRDPQRVGVRVQFGVHA